MILFTLGLLCGLLTMWLLDSAKRRQIKLLIEDKQRLRQEKQIVVEFMHNMVEAVSTGKDRQAMFQRIIHAAILSTNGMTACFFEKQPNNSLTGVAVEGLFPPQRKLLPKDTAGNGTRAQYLEKILKSETFQMGEGLIGQVARTRRAVFIADATKDPRVIQHEDPSLRIHSIIVAPILFQDELIAVLAVANPSDGLAFSQNDFSLMESLAEQVGLAVHNCDAMQTQIEKNMLDLDIELASSIQGLLLPTTYPYCEKVSFATHYTPAQKIGGDLYDIFSLDDHTVGVAIADVSGKGISGSILMAICQTHLRHFSKESRSPSDVLCSINRAMEATMRRDMFITIVYAIFDLETEEVNLARAGHEPPFYYKASDNGDHEVQPILSKGMAVGMVPPEIFDVTIQDTQIKFTKGDALVLYTDGVTESVNERGEEYSSSKMLDVVRAHGHEKADILLKEILNSVNQFCGDQGQPDDLTLITIKHA